MAWQADAWCSVVSDNFIASICATCFKIPQEEDGDMKVKCEKCGIAWYCSEKCKQHALPLHALECQCARQVVQVTQGKSDTRGARMMIRVLAARQLELQRHHESGRVEVGAVHPETMHRLLGLEDGAAVSGAPRRIGADSTRGQVRLRPDVSRH